MQHQNVVVGIRVRPLLDAESGEKALLSTSNGVVSLDKKEFSFDLVFDEEDTVYSQKQVFDSVGKQVVDAAVTGFNATLFAYGQSGSGKTFTMMGELGTTREGLIPRICREVLTKLKHAQISCSYCEIYEEKVADLLSLKTQDSLRLREHPDLGVFVDGLQSFPVEDFSQVMGLMRRGNEKRKVGDTLLNQKSSRSHAIFTLEIVQSKDLSDARLKKATEIRSKLHLVDLAGSERQEQSGASGKRLKEACDINASLTVLGRVIRDLAENSSTFAYRESKLTYLLKESLGGNSQTFMIATVSPAASNYKETLSTLQYAQKAKRVVNSPIVNQDRDAQLLLQILEENRQMKAELGKRGKNENDLEIEVRNLVESYELAIADLKEKVHLLEAKLEEQEETNFLIDKLKKKNEELKAGLAKRKAVCHEQQERLESEV